MGLIKADALTQAKHHLKASDYWTDGQLGAFCDDVVRDLSMRVPLGQKTPLPIISTTRTVDISVLSSLVRVLRVETPADTVPPDWRNWDIVGDILRIALDSAPSVTETLLTGTVTFTADDATLSGVGTAFETEVEAGNFIKRSTETTWYKVLSITSDTELEFTEDYASGDTGDDTINVTPCRTKASMAYIYWGKLHTVGAASTLDDKYDRLLVQGILAYAGMAGALDVINKVNIGDGPFGRYLTYAQQQMALYRKDVASIGPITVGQSHPRN